MNVYKPKERILTTQRKDGKIHSFGNVKADVVADKDPKFQRMNFCSVIRHSQWNGL